jgi:hypothetical protein
VCELKNKLFVIPAEAGIQGFYLISWIPAFAGMTGGKAGVTQRGFI